MYNLIIDVDIVSRTLPYRAEWASADFVVVVIDDVVFVVNEFYIK